MTVTVGRDFIGSRRGSYRILHCVDDGANRVEILLIDHRSDLYRSD